MQQTYTVRGHWPFPLDMLRHDDAKAFTPADQAIIDRLSGEYATDKGDFKPHHVQLVRDQSHNWSTPNFARWRSFGWAVVPESLPEHLREISEERKP